MSARLYAISYDIPSDSRRVRIANALKSYGERVQLSVFECWLAPDELAALKKRLERIYEAREDSIRLYPTTTDASVMGAGRLSDDPDVLMM